MPPSALAGLRVLEIGQEIAAPYCTKLLADLGADVIKIEPPAGDALRLWGPFPNDTPDPEASGLYHYLNTNKRAVLLDLESPDDRGEVLERIADCDLVIDSTGAGALERLGLGFDALGRCNPRLCLVQISAFGQTGPYCDWPDLDLIVQAAGAWVSGHGVPGVPPVRVGGRLAEYLAGGFAAAAALSGIHASRRNGRATHVDLSVMECLIGTLPYPMLHRQSLEDLGLPAPEVRYNPLPGIMKCRDGWVGINALTRPQWELSCALLEVPEYVDRLEEVGDSTPAYREFLEAARPWLEQRDMLEIIEEAQALRIPATLIGNGQTLRDSIQLQARDFFAKNPGPGFIQPGVPFHLSATPVRLETRAPSLLALKAQENTPEWQSRTSDPFAMASENTSPPTRPLEGIRVLDLGAFWAAPYATMYLASLGADVVKVESLQHPDGFRFLATTLEAGERWYEYGPLFQATNLGKRDITLDLSRPEGRQLFERLVARSDVLVENFAPRGMENWGFSFEALQRLRSDLIVVRMPGFGLEGPWRDYLGWALVIEQAAGMSWLVGHPEEDAPRNPGGFFDPAVGMHTAVAVQAALAHRRRTGEGQHIEIAQFELGACLTAESVIDYVMNERIQQRSGNRYREPAPHGIYPCLEGGWIAIAALDPEQWKSLTQVLGSPAWAGQPGFAGPGERTAHADSLDQHLAKETRSHSAPALAEKLRSQGVAAAEVMTSAQMYDDPQLDSRRYFQPLDHPVSGRRRYPTWPMRFSFLSGEVHRFGAPTLGQHNREVLGGELGLSEDELARLASEGIIGQRLPTSK